MHWFTEPSIGCARFLRLSLGLLLGALGAWADTTTYTTVVLTNENGLLDKLLAAGYGSSSPYQVMQYLQPYSNGAISTAFMAQLANCPPGSEIFVARLSSLVSSVTYPIGVNSDGTLLIADLLAGNYYGKTGYTTNNGTAGAVGSVRFTSADSASYYIDTGRAVFGSTDHHYLVTSLIWASDSTSANPAPPSAWLMLTGLGGAAAFGLRRRFQLRG